MTPLNYTMLIEAIFGISNIIFLCSQFLTSIHLFVAVFCAAETDKGICFGDAGAPFVSTVFSTEALVGISSYYQECGTYPDVFTRIDQYSNWILEIAAAPLARSALEGDTPKIAY